MTRDHRDFKDATIRCIAEILEVDAATIVGTDKLREDLGLDSLGSLELLSVLSEQFKIDLEVDGAKNIVTVDDACAFVEQSYREQRGTGPVTALDSRATDG